jgi:hypothetical protein
MIAASYFRAEMLILEVREVSEDISFLNVALEGRRDSVFEVVINFNIDW